MSTPSPCGRWPAGEAKPWGGAAELQVPAPHSPLLSNASLGLGVLT